MPRPIRLRAAALLLGAVTAAGLAAAVPTEAAAKAKAAPARSACTAPTLRYGQTSPAVSVVQQRLHVTPVTGYFGTKTRAAVLSFQRGHRLAADAIVGPRTWAALGGYPCPASTRAELDTAIRAYLSSRRGTAGVAVYDRRTGVTYSYRADAAYDTASTVKPQVLVTLLRQVRGKGRSLTSSQRSLATRMIRYSDNDATTSLWRSVGGGTAVRTADRLLGMSSTVPSSGGTWGLTRSTAGDQVKLVRALAYGSPYLASADRSYALSLMRSVTPSQKWGVSAGAAGSATVELKNGWLPRATHGWRVHSMGHVKGAGRDYAIAVMTQDNSTMGYGVSTVEGVSRVVWSALAKPLR